MSFLSYHHGTRIRESSETPVIVRVAQTAVVGLVGTAPDASDDAFPMHTPVLINGDPSKAAALGAGGTLKDALDGVFDQAYCNTVVIRVPEGATAGDTIGNVVGDSTARTGVHALRKAKPMLGMKPRLIAAPGFTSSDGSAVNPVVAELPAILDSMRAVAYVDGPDTDDAAAIQYRQNIGSQRIYCIDPKVQVWNTDAAGYVAQPASARFAGVQARTDLERGFWHSGSNKLINGIGGTTRPIEYGQHSNYLNEHRVATILNMGSGFITWGNRSCTDDDLWSFLPVRRSADFINEALEEAYLDFVDKPFSAANLKFLIESGNAAMRRFKREGAIIGGECWIDPTENDPLAMADGNIRLSVKFEPPAPMEDIGITAYREVSYYHDLVKDALAQAA